MATKIAVFMGDKLLVYLRDDRSDIPFPNQWDLPGGGREGDETPEACAIREMFEEFGVALHLGDLRARRVYPSGVDSSRNSVFFAAHLVPGAAAEIVFGDEGQIWRLVSPRWFLERPDAPAFLQRWLADYLEDYDV